MPDFSPWGRYSGLVLDQLCIIADAIKEARHTAVLSHDESLGDNGWTLGCVAYRRTCFAIIGLARRCPWLTILDEEHNKFTFTIGAATLKLYKGKPDDPPSRSLAISYPELMSIQQNLFAGTVPDGAHVLRLAIETDIDGEASSITLVELLDGEVTDKFCIPFTAQKSTVVPMMVKAVDLGPPSFTPLPDEEEKKEIAERNAS